MLALVLTAALLAAPQDAGPPPDEKKVEATVKDLKSAFSQSKEEEKLASIQRATDVLHPDVIKALAAGFREKEHEVQKATIEALRWMDHPKALDELHSAFKRDKDVAKDQELNAATLKAIGQHASKLSIDVLAGDPFKNPSHAAIEARILGLGRIRDADSVRELMAMMQKVGRGKSAAYMEHFRLSLMVLTGADNGKSREMWVKWWNDNKRSFKVGKKAPELPPKMQKRWDYYWGLEHVEGRAKKREDRGDDGERD
ncbi:MAG: HEAT repeat domain-containing protein [Planctomycetota bacterium]